MDPPGSLAVALRMTLDPAGISDPVAGSIRSTLGSPFGLATKVTVSVKTLLLRLVSTAVDLAKADVDIDAEPEPNGPPRPDGLTINVTTALSAGDNVPNLQL